jgi:hypothetical protein
VKGRSQWLRRGFAAVVIAAATALIWAGHAGGVYPEWQQYAFDAGTHGGGFSTVLQAYGHTFLGWYRPTSFFLAPYLLHVDYFNPTTVWATNLVFLGLVGVVLCLVVPRARVAAVLVGGIFVVGSSVLFYVPYAPQIDSLYVLFSIAFIVLALRLNAANPPRGVWRWPAWLGMLVTWFLAVTSKEIAAVVPLVAFAFLLMQQARLSLRGAMRAARIVAPFVVASAAYAVVYVHAGLQSANIDPNHTARPGLAKLSSVRDMLFWGLGLKAPGSQRPNWEVHFDRWVTLLAVLALAVGVAAVAIAWRRIGVQRIVLFALTYLGLAVAIGMFGSLPYHAFPLVVLVGFGLIHAYTAAIDRIGESRPSAVAFAELGLLAVAVAQVVMAHHIATRAITQGPQSAFLQASSELLTGPDLQPVRAAHDPLLVFEDCLQMAVDPLHYYAQARSGTQLVVPNMATATAEVRRAESDAEAAHRPVFEARCTGQAGPWYSVTEVSG